MVQSEILNMKAHYTEMFVYFTTKNVGKYVLVTHKPTVVILKLQLSNSFLFNKLLIRNINIICVNDFAS